MPGDPSSAAFFTALTLLKENSVLKIKNVGLNPTRIGFYELLKKSGANIKFLNIRKVNNEKVGDILVKSSNLKPLRASKNYITSTMDEYPILFVMSALIKGKSYFYNLQVSRTKRAQGVRNAKNFKTDRIYSKLNKDKLFIIGKNIHTIALNKVKVNNVFDHRIAMASAILALLTGVKSL